MVKKWFALNILFTGSLLAQNALYVFPPKPSTPVGGIQSVTAIVTGNTNKNVKWSASCGQIVGSGNTIGLKGISTGVCTLTATMEADPTRTATSTVTFEPLRPDLQAASIHPRLGLTPSDISELQAKVGKSLNQVYREGLSVYFNSIQSYYNQNFCWSGGNCGVVGPIGPLSSNGWIDNANSFTANGGGPFEEDMALYAFMSLIDPKVSNRGIWAAHAHDMAMWEINKVCYNASTGTGPCVPRFYGNAGQGTFTAFIGSQFILNNRAQTNTVPLLETIDYTYASFSAADKAVIRQVGHIWGKQLTGADERDVTDGVDEHVRPIGAYNSPAIINSGTSSAEGASNNYSLGHWQAMAFIGMLLDPADDVPEASCAPSTTTVCPSDGSAKTVGAYADYAVKGWLYRLYANFEDQHIVNAAYGLSDPFLCPDGYYTGKAPYNKKLNCTGQMSGGFVAEGTSYGYLSMGEMFETTHALYLGGKLNPANDPQGSFISSAFWDKLAISEVAQLWPLNQASGSAAYTPISNDPNFKLNESLKGVLLNRMEVYDAAHSSWRTALDKWYSYNNLPFGYENFFGRFMGSHGDVASIFGGTEFPINTLLATSSSNDRDFSISNQSPTRNAYDPRNAATLPVEFENLSSLGGFYHYYGRTDWTTNATQFQFHCNTGWQSHASSQCGRIDFIRNNEPLTIGLGGTSNDDELAQAPTHQNTVGYQWNPRFNCENASIDAGICRQGGMASDGYSLYSSIVLGTSSNADYYYGAVDPTGAYGVAFNDCQHCAETANVDLSQREVLWLKPDVIFVYDRAETKSSSSFKNFHLDVQTVPAISGNLASVTSPKGQKLFITALLPATSTWSQSALDISHERDSPVKILLTNQTGTAPSIRMLHILEGKNSGEPSATSLVRSSGGTEFEGGVVGRTLVLFKRRRADAFSSTTFPASGATKGYVTGLVANARYAISGLGVPDSATADSAGVLVFGAAGTGNITVSGPGPSAQDQAASLKTPDVRNYGQMLVSWRALRGLLPIIGLLCLTIVVLGHRRKFFRRNDTAVVEIQQYPSFSL